MARALVVAVGALWFSACAHVELTQRALDSVSKPAIVSRLAQPKPVSTVFRQDSTYNEALGQKSISPAEGDRRLAEKLTRGSTEGGPSMSRFELTDTLRAQTLAFLPRGIPWTDAVSAADVARVLETLLVEDASAKEPDYEQLAQLGADSVVELIIEEYGMHSEKGRAGIYVVGTARLMRLDGAVLYQRKFISDEVKAGLETLNPFAVAKNPPVFRDRMKTVLTAIAEKIAEDLTPSGAAAPTGARGVQPRRKKAEPKKDDDL